MEIRAALQLHGVGDIDKIRLFQKYKFSSEFSTKRQIDEVVKYFGLELVKVVEDEYFYEGNGLAIVFYRNYYVKPTESKDVAVADWDECDDDCDDLEVFASDDPEPSAVRPATSIISRSGILFAESFQELQRAYEYLSYRGELYHGVSYMFKVGPKIARIDTDIKPRYRLNDVKDLYSEDITILKDFLESDEKLLILLGPPGTGKTRLIEAIIGEIQNKSLRIVYGLNTEVQEEASFWVQPADLIVADDADSSLSGRDSNAEFALKDLLRLTDGLVDISPHIILTSNIPSVDIDPALKRDGRLFARLEFKPLRGEQIDRAIKAIKRLYPDMKLKAQPTKDEMMLSEIFALFKKGRVQEVIKGRVGFV